MRAKEYIYFIVISMCIDAIDFNSNRLTIVHTLKHAKWILEWYQYHLVTTNTHLKSKSNRNERRDEQKNNEKSKRQNRVTTIQKSSKKKRENLTYPLLYYLSMEYE